MFTLMLYNSALIIVQKGIKRIQLDIAKTLYDQLVIEVDEHIGIILNNHQF